MSAAIYFQRPEGTHFVRASFQKTVVHLFNEDRRELLTVCNQTVTSNEVDLKRPVCRDCAYLVQEVKA